MPKEYIEREAVMSDIKNLSVFLGGDNVFNKTAKGSVLDIIYFQPTADVVEVVRCGECVHSKKRNKEEDTVMCLKYMAYKGVKGFCNEGIRNE